MTHLKGGRRGSQPSDTPQRSQFPPGGPRPGDRDVGGARTVPGMRRHGAQVSHIWAALAVFALSLAALAGCGASPQSPAKPLRAAPEPAVSPPASVPAGTVVALPGGPEGVAITSSGLVAVNVRQPDGLVVVPIDRLASASARRFVALAGSARHLTLAGPDGPALVAQESTDELVEVALNPLKVTVQAAVGRQPHEAFEVGEEQWVANEFGNTFDIVRGDRVVGTVAAPLQPGGGAVSLDGQLVVGVGVRGRRITEYRADGTIVGSANCGAGPTHVVTGSDGHFWVNDTNGGAILGFTLTPHGPRQVATIHLGAGSKPYGIAYDAVHHILLTTLTGRDQLVELSLRGTAVIGRRIQSTVQQPNTAAVDPATRQVVITGSTPAGHLELLSE
jgi:hypothetical protein